MDRLQLEQWNTDPRLREAMTERVTILHRLVAMLAALIAATAILMLWVLGSPDSHQENGAVASVTWPDGSPKTSHDWWANAGGHPPGQVAQPPAPASAPSPPPPPHRG
jgi:hypothetical protein